MSVSLFETVAEGVIKSWLSHALFVISKARIDNKPDSYPARALGRPFEHIPENITMAEFEFEIIPDIKKEMGIE